jgi:hypothetical protein
MARLGFGTSLMVTLALALSLPGKASAQGQALPSMKVNLPSSPNFDVATAPLQYPTGEMSVYGLRKGMSKYLDKDVRVKAFVLEVYECPAEQRKCNDDAAAKAKRDRRKAIKNPAPPAPADEKNACRPCDQPHFYIADTPTTKKERALLVADYPVKDWKTGKPKPLDAKAGQQYIVTGTFAINSMTGFAASNGLLVHKKMEDLQGKVVADGNAVLPPEAQTINLEGKAPEKVGSAALPPKK